MNLYHRNEESAILPEIAVALAMQSRSSSLLLESYPYKNSINKMKNIDKNKTTMGAWAEHQAGLYLTSNGFQVLHQNYYSRFGEIDLIVRNAQDLIFVEVKARSKTKYGQSHEVISNSKQQKIIKTALTYLSEYPDMSDLYCRFDVICFDFQQQFAKTVQHDFSHFTYDLNWIENAFTFDPEFINL